MDTHYQPIYRQAAAMQHKFHDYTHANAVDPAAKALRNQLHNLTNDLATGKNPRTIESRMRNIQMQLRRTQSPGPTAMPGQSPILNNIQTRTLNQNFEAMRNNIRQHPHF